MYPKISCFIIWLLLPLNAACGAADAAEDPAIAERGGTSAAALHVDLEGLLTRDDVSQIAFRAQRVSCAGETFEPTTVTRTAAISDLLLPVDNPSISDQPLAPDSRHAFADVLIALEPGCYDITLVPSGPTGLASTHCLPARAVSVRIEPQLTTEIVLVSQCSSSEMGLGDTVIAFNHAPTLSEPSYADTRFVATCRPTRICVTASDADRDPLELVWTLSAESAPPASGPVVVSSVQSAGTLEECVSVVPRDSGWLDFVVTAYDRASASGAPTRVEDLLLETGSGRTSHASVSFSLLASGNGQCQR